MLVSKSVTKTKVYRCTISKQLTMYTVEANNHKIVGTQLMLAKERVSDLCYNV